MKKITFVYPDFESIGLEYLMAVCRNNGFDIDFVYYQAEDISFGKIRKNIPFDEIAEKIINTQSSIVAFSCVTDNYRYQLSCARAIKALKPDTMSVFGGIHVTSAWEHVIKEDVVDAIAIGESEKSFIDFLEACEFGKTCIFPQKAIKGFIFKKGGKTIGKFAEGEITQPDELPFPHKEPFYDALKAFSYEYRIMTSRGCPYSCSYCSNAYLKQLMGKSLVKRRSVGNVIEELKWAKKKFKFKYVLFLDDSFITDKYWFADFCKEYKRCIQLPFSCIAIPQYIDRLSAKMLGETGCVSIQIGVQSTDKNICEHVIKRYSDVQKIGEAITMLKKERILVQVDHMLGIPTDTIQAQENSLLFYNKYRPDLISVFWLTYYPSTPIIDTALKEGILLQRDIDSINNGYRINQQTSYEGGSLRHPEEYYGVAYLLNYLPLFPKWLVNILVRGKFYRKISIKNYFLMVILPRVIQGIFNKRDFRDRSNIARYFNKILAKT